MRWCGMALACATLLGAGACAHHPPTAQVATASRAVRRAQNLQAGHYSPMDLRLAREELERAQRAVEDEDYDRARRLAEQASVDAELAAAKVRAERARARVARLRRGIATPADDGQPPLSSTGPPGR